MCKSNRYAIHLKPTQTHFPILYLWIIIMKTLFPINAPFLGQGSWELKKWVWMEGEGWKQEHAETEIFSRWEYYQENTAEPPSLHFPKWKESARKKEKKQNSPNHNANKYLGYRPKFLLTVYQVKKELGLPRVIYEHREISA